MVEFARQHDLVVLADEIYDKILYDDAVHTVHRVAGSRRLLPDLQRPVEVLPGGRFPRRAGSW